MRGDLGGRGFMYVGWVVIVSGICGGDGMIYRGRG